MCDSLEYVTYLSVNAYKTQSEICATNDGVPGRYMVGRGQGIVDERTQTIHKRLAKRIRRQSMIRKLAQLMELVDRTDPAQEQLYQKYQERMAALKM
jgi:hypothetical protein